MKNGAILRVETVPVAEMAMAPAQPSRVTRIAESNVRFAKCCKQVLAKPIPSFS